MLVLVTIGFLVTAGAFTAGIILARRVLGQMNTDRRHRMGLDVDRTPPADTPGRRRGVA